MCGTVNCQPASILQFSAPAAIRNQHALEEIDILLQRILGPAMVDKFLTVWTLADSIRAVSYSAEGSHRPPVPSPGHGRAQSVRLCQSAVLCSAGGTSRKHDGHWCYHVFVAVEVVVVVESKAARRQLERARIEPRVMPMSASGGRLRNGQIKRGGKWVRDAPPAPARLRVQHPPASVLAIRTLIPFIPFPLPSLIRFVFRTAWPSSNPPPRHYLLFS